jgi:TIGR03009 family protein
MESMRAYCLSGLALLLSSSALFAQADDLTTILRGWEKSLAGAKTIKCQITRVSDDRALKTHDVLEGHLLFSKTAGRQQFHYELKKDGKLADKYIVDGKDLYEYVPATNVVRIQKMPQVKDGALGLLSLLFDINPQQAQARYAMEIEKAGDETDKHYHYIRIRPKGAANKGAFQEAQVTLARSTHLPRRIAYQQINTVVITWDFKEMKLNEQIPDKLLAPALNGWRVERVQPAPAGK